MPDPRARSRPNAAYQRHIGDIAGLALRTGPDLYPSVSLALASLDWIQEQSLVVLGFEGFTTDGVRLVPSLEHIADFSAILDGLPDWAGCVMQSIDASKRVLPDWIGDVQFVDMTLTSEDEHVRE
jgi:hypothetical protein